MFWWFERNGEFLRLEVLQVGADHYELRVIKADGTVTTETFSTAEELAKRQGQVEGEMSQHGWSGPHGWVL